MFGTLGELLEDRLNAWSFEARRRTWGRLRLRNLPDVSRLSPQTQAERAFYRLLLSRAFASKETMNSISSVVDVGCRNWSYARALADFFPNASLLGVELDGGRRYWNFYRRQDFAQAYASDLIQAGRSARFFAGDFVSLATGDIEPSPGTLLFTFFYPFVSENPCLKWGLPARYSEFSPLLARARNLGVSLQRKTEILSAHQGEWELELAGRAYSALGLAPRSHWVPAADFAGLWPARHDVYLLSCSLAADSCRTH